MEIYGEISKVRAAVKAWKKEGLTVGFVPTMGYLHEGHKSLIDAARKENDRVVVSIFVNPMQFGPTEDLESYPRDLKKDAALCEAAGVDIIFHPEPEEMYADGFCSYVDMNGLTTELCGKSRPIHFRGVQTVVLKPAACRHPPYGQRFKRGHYNHRLPDHPRSRRSCQKLQKYLFKRERTSGCTCIKPQLKSRKSTCGCGRNPCLGH